MFQKITMSEGETLKSTVIVFFREWDLGNAGPTNSWSVNYCVEVFLQNKKTTQAGNFELQTSKNSQKSSREAVRDCIICRKLVAQGGQHLHKVHRNLLPRHQSVNCPLRLTKPRRHKNDFLRHNILELKKEDRRSELKNKMKNSHARYGIVRKKWFRA